LSRATRSVVLPTVDAVEFAGEPATTTPFTALLVMSRAESHIFFSEYAPFSPLILDETVADSGEARSRLWKASCAPFNAPFAGRLAPHCSHALLMFARVCLFSFFCVCFFALGRETQVVGSEYYF